MLVDGGRKRGVRELSAISHLGRAAGGGIGRAAAGKLGSEQRIMGRNATAGPIYADGASSHDAAGHAGLDCVRMIGEAASRSNSVDPTKIMQFMKGGTFGVALTREGISLRDWDWQIRQPILLADGRTVVSVSPQPGFLHQFTELDTLGFDPPETHMQICTDLAAMNFLVLFGVFFFSWRPADRARCLHGLCVERARQHHQRGRSRPDEDCRRRCRSGNVRAALP